MTADGHDTVPEIALGIAQAYVRETAETVCRLEAECLEDVVWAGTMLIDSLRAGGKVLICGNGGSAADAQHLAAEFVSSFTIENLRPSIPAIALTTDTSILTAIANDFGVDGIFSRQVDSLGHDGDVLIAISTSGNSANVVRAAEAARGRAMWVVALTGEGGGALGKLANVAIRVPSTVTAHIQECHLVVEQLLAMLVERALYSRG